VKIALVQMQVREHALEQNTSHGMELMEEAAAHSELVVLPEIWNTGYSLAHLSEKALPITAELIKQICALAKKYKCAIIAGSIPIVRRGKVYNCSLAINKQGQIVNQYDKAHLFGMFHEEAFFAPGQNFDCFDLDGITCGSTICYDLRFPELYRREALEGAKIIFVPAEWPVTRGPFWDLLLRARAAENHLFVVGVNCTGTFKGQRFYGHSQIIDPSGKVLVCGTTKEAILYHNIKLEAIDKVRKTLNALNDVRPELVRMPKK
jgi:omega-amidase